MSTDERREAVAALCQQSEKESHQPAHDLRELPHQLSPEEVDRFFPLTPEVPPPLGEPDEQLDIEMFEPGLLPATQRPGTPTRVLVPSSNAAAREPSELMDANACLVCLPTCSYGSGRPASRGQTGAFPVNVSASRRPGSSARVRGSPNHGGQGHTPCLCLVYEGGQPRFCDTANTENPASALVPTEGGGLSCPQAGGFTVVTPDGRRPIDTSTTPAAPCPAAAGASRTCSSALRSRPSWGCSAWQAAGSTRRSSRSSRPRTSTSWRSSRSSSVRAAAAAAAAAAPPHFAGMCSHGSMGETLISIEHNITNTVGRAFTMRSRGHSMAIVDVCGVRAHSERSHGNVMVVLRGCANGGGDHSPARPLGVNGERIYDEFDECVNYVVEKKDGLDRDANCVVEDRARLPHSTAQFSAAAASVDMDTTSGRKCERRALHAGGTVQNKAWQHSRTYEQVCETPTHQARGGVYECHSHFGSIDKCPTASAPSVPLICRIKQEER